MPCAPLPTCPRTLSPAGSSAAVMRTRQRVHQRGQRGTPNLSATTSVDMVVYRARSLGVLE
eukprot:1723999-Pleurochrysis_carterae.AAC.1